MAMKIVVSVEVSSTSLKKLFQNLTCYAEVNNILVFHDLEVQKEQTYIKSAPKLLYVGMKGRSATLLPYALTSIKKNINTEYDHEDSGSKVSTTSLKKLFQNLTCYAEVNKTALRRNNIYLKEDTPYKKTASPKGCTYIIATV